MVNYEATNLNFDALFMGRDRFGDMDVRLNENILLLQLSIYLIHILFSGYRTLIMASFLRQRGKCPKTEVMCTIIKHSQVTYKSCS